MKDHAYCVEGIRPRVYSDQEDSHVGCEKLRGRNVSSCGCERSLTSSGRILIFQAFLNLFLIWRSKRINNS